MERNYVAYHVHSDDSLLDSCTKFRDYVDRAVELGQTAIASTEHGKPLNWVEKKMYCDEKGIKFIFGVECYLTESLAEKVRDNFHTILIAKNAAGREEINQLVFDSTDEDHSYYKNRITFDEFFGVSDNVIKISACLASPLNKLGRDHPMHERLARKYDYYEIQPHNHPDQIKYNQELLFMSREYGKPLIAGTDTHALNDYKAECRSILLLGKGIAYSDEDAFNLTYRSYDELVEDFTTQDAMPEQLWMEAIQNTVRMADSVDDFKLDTSIKYPILYGSVEADRKKFHQVIADDLEKKRTMGWLYNEKLDAYNTKLEEEKRVFAKVGMEGFMLIMSEFIKWCRDEGIPVGPGRGSVTGSTTAYITDITDVDPVRWNTVFSRFCNEDRVEIGDIDIDIIDTDRPKIFEYIVGRFGNRVTARVASYGTIADKGAIDDIGRALARKWKECNPEKTDGDNPYSLNNVSKIKSLYGTDSDKARETYPDLFYYFDGIIGTKVSQSVHPAGLVVAPCDLINTYGAFHKDGDICLEIDMDQVHEVGLAKFDFLILRNIAIIRDTCGLAGIPYPRAHEVDWCDQAVWKDMLKSPVGIFQMEGAYAFQCLRQFKVQSLYDMSLVTAAIRPSGASYRKELLDRKPRKNPSKMIDNLLADNNGYLIYQEDTIKFLQDICGMSGSESDNIRRAIGRKQKDRLDQAMPSILEGYCRMSDQPREVAEGEAKEFLQIIEDSAAYQFG